MAAFRHIPSIDVLLQQPAIAARAARQGHAPVVESLRAAADAWRTLAKADAAPPGDPAVWIAERAMEALETSLAASLRPVINATGVIIHTNLGRAPLANAAVARAMEVARGYANLEYDLEAGARGHRHVHAERLLCALTGAEAAIVANNNAAGTWLVLAALASGREVIVSRGELVEIGGGFRVPEIMAQSGARLREVGTTNRTRLSDYAAAISDRTALILRVHPSNFRIEGFTERPALKDLSALARRFHLPVFEDQGSGWLGLPQPGGWPEALRDEPSVGDSVGAGVSLVAFSGDKLLGGPQAGLIVGQRALVDQVRRHPLMRAVRADKQTYAALEATLGLWQREPARTEIPVVRMLLEPVEALERRAQALASSLGGTVKEGLSTIGGGSAPQSAIPTRLVSIRSTSKTAAQIEAALRAGSPPVIARIQQDTVLLDLRTVHPDEDSALQASVLNALGPAWPMG
ncbi:MAG: L-seryl-tRNA(Sec) selenium transferase [Acidobacteria bacterium]|nr:L-seryl-tRNA(Sec) selenium transferase [Acidobacteriota bacterium]